MNIKKIAMIYGAWAVGIYAYNRFVVPAMQGTTLQLPALLDPIAQVMPYPQIYIGQPSS